MHLLRRFSSIIVLILVYLLFANILFSQDQLENQFNCYSIIVGKAASADGAVLVAHNEDDGGTQLVNYYRVPRLKHEPGETITFETGATIPQVEQTNSYLWLEMPRMEFSDSYLNEWGVLIASDACASRENQGQLTNGGIKYWLRRLVAERAHSAREGVRIAGELIDDFGYAASGRTYIIADVNEGWMLSAVSGKHWIAQRVPDDQIAVIPNYYTIGAVDLADTNNFLGSSDLIDYAIQRGWYDPARDGNFHFAKTYSSPENLKNPGNIHRKWRGLNLLSDTNYVLDDEFPFAVKPKKKITLQDLMSVLRDHYVGTELDQTNGYKIGNPYKLNGSTICASSTQYGFIAQLRNWLALELGAVLWLAQRRPDSQAFIPWYLGIEKIPDGYASSDFQTALNQHFDPPENIYNRKNAHAFWEFVRLAEWVDADYGMRIFKVRQQWDVIEQQLLFNQRHFEAKVVSLYSENPVAAKKSLTDYTCNWAAKTCKMAAQIILLPD